MEFFKSNKIRERTRMLLLYGFNGDNDRTIEVKVLRIRIVCSAKGTRSQSESNDN